MLYNPDRLVNITPRALERGSSVAHDAPRVGPHLRRSLPLCNPGNLLLPLESLIDGPAQTDKCGRATPSGPAWALFMTGTNSDGYRYTRIVASFARFALVGEPETTYGLLNVHPENGDESNAIAPFAGFLEQMEGAPYEGSTLRYPPLVVGDFNQLPTGWNPKFLPILRAPLTIDEPMAIDLGKADEWASSCRGRARDGMLIPIQQPPSCPGRSGVLLRAGFRIDRGLRRPDRSGRATDPHLWRLAGGKGRSWTTGSWA